MTNPLILDEMIKQLTEDINIVRTVAARSGYRNTVLRLGERLDEVAADMIKVRNGVEEELIRQRRTAANDIAGDTLFGGYRTKYTQQGATFAGDGRLNSWHAAVKAVKEHAATRSDSMFYRDMGAKVARAIRVLVEESGEDPNDTQALNICLSTISEAAGVERA
jgi:hypothetical protein